MDELERLQQRVEHLEKQFNIMQQSCHPELLRLEALVRATIPFVQTLRGEEKDESYSTQERDEFFVIIEDHLRQIDDIQKALRTNLEEAQSWSVCGNSRVRG